ncbi:glycosyltransferase family 1 protein [Microbispora cellulosiformans]|uniref:Glycosyltransferase family 1 protein n=1 Tax=Microbispora cellulosiformans TaxID=2614688 RepID=A0A5J5K1B4_9ACTN|nr:glycosyltransferase family 1 protein [Microbispora cellulosiformans]
MEGRLRIAMIGTRGVPARYGGFETAVEEIGARLVEAGHEVRVYCRSGGERMREYRGMRLVHLPAVRHKVLETLSHTALSVGHLLGRRTDVALVFNAANSPLLPLVRAARIPVATHVDGLEWKRAKWNGTGRRYYLVAERLAVRWSDEIIADARGIQDYYRERYKTASVMIPYGAPVQEAVDEEVLRAAGYEPGRYHLVVARFEPENHVDLIVEGYTRSAATYPLVVVGSAPYAAEYTRGIERLAEADPRVTLTGGIWDQRLLDALYAGAATYLHGHSVGGTNPSLLRAMGAGAPVVAYDVNFNREVLGETGEFFADAASLAKAVEDAEADPARGRARGDAARERARTEYTWDDVAARYEALCRDLLAKR